MADNQSDWGRYAGLGMEILVGVVLGLVVGWWLDGKLGFSPWGTVIGTMLGLAGGMYLLIKQAIGMK
mgnify:CR=1 FL=1